MSKKKSNTSRPTCQADRRRNPPRARRSPTPRSGQRKDKHRKRKRDWLKTLGEKRRVRRAYERLKKHVFRLFTRDEVKEIAKGCGFQQRRPKEIPPFEFALCCALASVVEYKRGFASVWRLLAAAANIKVARSAVTQRFGEASAAMMEALFEQAVRRLPEGQHPEMLAKLEQFRQVLAQDGSVVKLSPVLKKLFPATRTNSVDAAAKVHATADILNRRILAVEVTGERESERAVARAQGIEPGTLYIRDLGYTCYDDYAAVVSGGADFLMRLKDDANPVVVKVRHGVIAPRRSEGKKLNDLSFTIRCPTFDLDARFGTSNGPIVLRVVGHYNPETNKYHCYVTSLPPEEFSVEELETLYSLRWVIELLFKFLKSSCHLDHVDTSNVDALRTHIFASLLAATVLSAVLVAAAEAAGIPVSEISILTVGIAAPLLVLPLMLLWLEREITYDELAAIIIRVVVIGCRDQNRGRTSRKWGSLSGS